MNSPKPRIQALEGIVETDWANSTFTMNWIFTEPGTVRFEKGEPFCVIVPYPRNYIEQFEGEIVPLSQEPEMRDAFKAWSASRADFLQHLGDPSHAAGRDGWQKDYMLGRDVGEPTVDDHQTHLELRPFLKNGKAR
jgi:hypothetical protein